MTVPSPPIQLEGHCSVINNSTLYVYSPKGFVSIPLKEHGNWTQLDPGVKVSGAVCLTGGIEGNESDEALYVVGGTGASSASYMGLQRYSFKQQKWESLNAGGGAIKNLQYHGAGYIKSNSTIVVYAGNTAGQPSYSSSTLTISTISPYGTSSELGQGVPPALNPVLWPWSDSQVALISGSTNPAIYIYGDSTGWIPSGASLPAPVQSPIQCALIHSGGDKVVEEFNLGADPNIVTSYALSMNGQPMSPAPQIGTSSGKRSVNSYPAYNSTFAPSQTRSNFALAQGKNGLVVISSGQGEHSLAIFNSTSNAWVNSTRLFHGTGQQHALKATATATSTTSTTTPTVTTSPTSSHTPTSSAAPVATQGASSDWKTILGATLGGVCGLALILIAILYLLRRQKRKRRQTGPGVDGKDRFSFQDQGIEPLTEGAYPMAKSPVPLVTASNDSLAMSGRTGEKSLQPPPAHIGYGLSKPGRSSPLSTIPSSGLAGSSVYSDDADRSAKQPGARTTDEGWAKYFQHNSSNLAGMQADRSTVSSNYTKSDYRGSAWPMTDLPPLSFGFMDQPKPLGRVASGSPTTGSLIIPEGQSARISSASADSESIASDGDDKDWQAGQSSWLGRPPSSTYSTSFYDSSTQDFSTMVAEGLQQSNGRVSSAVVPDDGQLSTQERSNVNSDMSWLNLQASR